MTMTLLEAAKEMIKELDKKASWDKVGGAYVHLLEAIKVEEVKLNPPDFRKITPKKERLMARWLGSERLCVRYATKLVNMEDDKLIRVLGQIQPATVLSRFLGQDLPIMSELAQKAAEAYKARRSTRS